MLAHEYPVLNEAYRQANSLPLMEAASVTRDTLGQLKEAHEKNLEIIRKGLRLELQRFATETAEKARPPIPNWEIQTLRLALRRPC